MGMTHAEKLEKIEKIRQMCKDCKSVREMEKVIGHRGATIRKWIKIWELPYNFGDSLQNKKSKRREQLAIDTWGSKLRLPINYLMLIG